MGCIKSTKKILRKIAQEITPYLIQFAVDKVKEAEATAVAYNSLDSTMAAYPKAEVVSELIQMEAAAQGVDLSNRRVNLLREFAVEAVKGDEDESELGQDDRTTEEPQ